jgi:DNA mismatch repair protein MLH1
MKEKKISNCRSSVRQRRNPKETADITSIQELIEEIDCNYHSGEIFTHLFDC